EQALAAQEAALAGLEDQLAVLRPRVDGFREQVRAAERGLAVTRERGSGLTEQRGLAETDARRLEEQLARLTQEAAEHAGAPSATDPTDGAEELDTARARLDELARAYEVAQAARAEAAQGRDVAERRMLDAESRLARTADQLRGLEGSLAVDE